LGLPEPTGAYKDDGGGHYAGRFVITSAKSRRGNSAKIDCCQIVLLAKGGSYEQSS
jgi:hypothetical protein